MGMYDEYIPDPPLHCPVCGALLAGWQGYDGPNGLMVWKQGVAAPIDQPIDDDVRLDPGDLKKMRLPSTFTIHASCCSTKFNVEAVCKTSDGTWSQTDLVTVETAQPKKDERRADYKARLSWLGGKAK